MSVTEHPNKQALVRPIHVSMESLQKSVSLLHSGIPAKILVQARRWTPQQLTETILEAGRRGTDRQELPGAAASTCVQSAEGLAKIDKATPCRYNAPTCLVVAFDQYHMCSPTPASRRDSGVEDATIVATHMILAAANAGVDSCWVNFFDPEQLAKELGLPENEEILMIMDLGHAAPGAVPLPNHGSRKPLADTVTYL